MIDHVPSMYTCVSSDYVNLGNVLIFLFSGINKACDTKYIQHQWNVHDSRSKHSSIVNEYLCWRNLKNLKRCTFPARIYVPHDRHNGITMLNESGECPLNYMQLCNYLGRSHGSHNAPGIVKEYTEKTWTILSTCHSKFTLILNRILLKTE